MTREEIFQAYFSDPKKVSSDSVDSDAIFISNLGISFNRQLSALNFKKSGFKASILVSDDFSFDIDDYEGDAEDFPYECLRSIESADFAENSDLILVECCIQDNLDVDDRFMFTDLTCIDELYASSVISSTSPTDSNGNRAVISAYGSNFKILLEQDNDHVFIIEYAEDNPICSTRSSHCVITEIINGEKTKAIEHWTARESERREPSPWKITYYQTEVSE